MKRWALIEGELVANVVEQDSQPQIEGLWVEIVDGKAGPGWEYIDGQFIEPPIPPIPPLPPIITKLAFRFRLTDAEYVGILAAAKTDVEVMAWVETFNMVSQINLDDSRTVSGLEMMVTKLLLTEERKTEILTAPVQDSERP
jgi:hypothetical protein